MSSSSSSSSSSSKKRKVEENPQGNSLTQKVANSIFLKKINPNKYEKKLRYADSPCIEIKAGRGAAGTVTKKGYVQIGITNATKHFAHRIAYAYYNGVDKLPKDRKQHVSHLCHNKLCIKESHLHVEPDMVNRSRNWCAFTVFCQGCTRSVNACIHKPKCVAPHEDRSKDLEKEEEQYATEEE